VAIGQRGSAAAGGGAGAGEYHPNGVLHTRTRCAFIVRSSSWKARHAWQPTGDLVSCDVVRASVNPLIRRLRSAGVAERGGITMTELEAVISSAADRAQAGILTPEIDTIVWEEVSARTSDDASFSVSFGALMVLAGLLAGGVVTLLGTRVWARRIEAGRGVFGPKAKPHP
jgi:hypothetical protein